MKRHPVFLLALIPLAGSLSGAAEREIGGRTFQFPDDYTLELVAGPPLVDRPVEADFDASGALYVTESSGTNDPVAVQAETREHRVLRLTDADGDGIFETRTVFADSLMFPEGILCMEPGSVLVSAVPEIWRITDTDGDGVSDRREVWFDGETVTGCANDLHGPYRGPDGRIYWTKGGFAVHRAVLPGRREPVLTRMSHVYRANPDGSNPEIVMTGGMDNPVGLAWTPEGEMILSCTFLQHPGGGKRDGLIHAVYGGLWGKTHDELERLPRTGDLLPPMTHLGPAAPAGICFHDGALLACQFNLRKVSRHRLIPDGSTFRTEDDDFLVCDHPDFHPTDVLEAPDGSVLVIDTGGWYKLCCPTSQIWKPEALGAIYRLRRNSPAVPAAAAKPAWTVPDDSGALTAGVGSPDLHYRRRCIEALGRRRERAAVPVILQASAAPDADRFLRHAIVIALMESADPQDLKGALQDAPLDVRHAAVLALEEVAPDDVPAEAVLGLLGTRWQEDGLRIASRHPSWDGEIAGWLERQLENQPPEHWRRAVAAFRTLPRCLQVIGAAMESAAGGPDRLEALLGVAAETGGGPLPAEWERGIVRHLAEGTEPIRRLAVRVCHAHRKGQSAEVRGALVRVAEDPGSPPPLRVSCLAALESGPGALSDAVFGAVRAELNADRPVTFRVEAARVLAVATLTDSQRREVLQAVASAGPVELPALLGVFAGGGPAEDGIALVRALAAGGSLGTLSDETIHECFRRYPEGVKSELAAKRAAARAAVAGALPAGLEASLPQGDPGRGALVFRSAKAACTACHQTGYTGGTLGPDLTRIGAVRTPSDLLEAIVVPGASFVRSYEPVQVTMADGSIHYGIIRDHGSERVVLATGIQQEVTLPAADVQSIQPGTVSLMPGGLDAILTRQELADLIAFLGSLK